MSNFTGDLSITELAFKSNKNWRLNQELIFWTGAEESQQFIVVPAGFETDGASVPRILWPIIPTWGRYSRAAVVHDYLYARLRDAIPHPFATTRKAADGVFLEAMGVCQVNRVVKYAMYFGVRLFGWAAILN